MLQNGAFILCGNSQLSATKYSTLGGVRIDYEYAASGNGIYQVKRVTTGSNSVAYGYDKFGHTVTETRTIEGESPVTFGYAYDANDRLQSATYPGNVTVSRAYDAFGNLEKVQQGATVVWQLTGMTGAATTATLGGMMTATASYNTNGFLSGLSTVKGSTPVRNFTYGFNGATGNLTTRTGMIAQQETFYYDALDRLKTINHGVPEALAMSVGYKANGNIETKTDLGLYTYGSDAGPHALTGVENTGNLISQNDQTITYTAFNKVSQINETVGTDAYQLNITYGPDQQRWKTILKKNDNPIKTIIFAGDYEKITDNGVTRELYYISGGNGLAAVYVKTGSSYNTYYAHTDHLGSIVSLTDGNGNPVFKATYDAWGKQDTTINTIGFHRGYTGHEHLDKFGLINMNGRMYDPMVGRFLSPDPYVQAPDFSQSFNRYSYVLNNPLIYTDPDGENPIIVAMIIGAVIGTYSGGVIANNGQYNPTKWDYSSGKTWGYMLGGAVVGGLSGYAGGYIATSGIPMANTAAIAGASLINSVGTWAYTGGQTPISISLGVASYDFTNNNFGYLGKKGNSVLENIGYGFGALANVSDMVSLFRGGGQNIKTNSAKTKGVDVNGDPNDWWGHSAITDENGNGLVSFGPDSPVGKSASISETWQNSIKGAKVWDTYLGQEGTWSVELNNVSTTAISKYASGVTRWDLLLNSCVGHTSRALWSAGVPNIYLFHPHMLNLQLLIRQLGIYSSPYLYQIPKTRR